MSTVQLHKTREYETTLRAFCSQVKQGKHVLIARQGLPATGPENLVAVFQLLKKLLEAV